MPDLSMIPSYPAGRSNRGASFCLATMTVMAFIIFLLAGCSRDQTSEWGLALVDPRLEYTGEELSVVAGLRLEPSPAMVEALERGIEWTLAVQTRAATGQLWLPGIDRIRKNRVEINYLPLSRHYQLHYLRDGSTVSFPRLNMLIAELEKPQPWSVKLEADEIKNEVWRVQARAELDHSRLPSPMRLPTWFDPQWRLRTRWQEWSTAGVEVDGE